MHSWQENHRNGDMLFLGHDKGGKMSAHISTGELALTTWWHWYFLSSTTYTSSFSPMQLISIFCRGNSVIILISYCSSNLYLPPTCLSIHLDGWQMVVFYPHRSFYIYSFHYMEVFPSSIYLFKYLYQDRCMDSFFIQWLVILN